MHRSAPGRPLYVDVTDTLARAERTGVQRVVRQFVRWLPSVAQARGRTVTWVAAVDGRFHRVNAEGMARLGEGGIGQSAPIAPSRTSALVVATLRWCRPLLAAVQGWRLNRRLRSALLPCVQPAPLGPTPSGTVLLLDSYWGGTTSLTAAAAARRAGSAVVAVVYDLIPITHPAYSPAILRATFPARLRRALRLASGCLAISRTVAAQVATLLDAEKAAVSIRHFWLGNDPSARSEPDDVVSDQTFVMLGSIEPHKGHDVALAAFDMLWATGSPVHLTLIGRLGSDQALNARLSHHPELGRRLHLIAGASDRDVADLMAGAAALIMASRAEGFGLPIVEALRGGTPVIAADLPIFQEIGGDTLLYFAGGDAEALAGAVARLLRDQADWRARAAAFRWLTWRESVEAALEAITELERPA